MRTTHLFCTLIGVGFCIMLSAAPRLTVVVVVDGLHAQNLEQLQSYWPQGGLRTISEEGKSAITTFDQFISGGGESVATLMTGEFPSQNGVADNYYFSRTDRKVYPILYDKSEHGIGCTQTLSPRTLCSPTLTDYVRMRYGTDSKMYAIGLDPISTLLMAGHAANACCWLDEGKRWATTSFYSEGLPAAADEMNISGRLETLATRTWTPRMDIGSYMYPTDIEKKKSFSYSCNQWLKQSPAANEAVIELALSIQQKEELGTDSHPDMLLLQLTTRTPRCDSDPIVSAEQEDMYLWLNQDIGYLMEQLNKRIGKQHYQLIILGKPMYGTSKNSFEMANLPVRDFNVDQAAALTSTYLMALYGHKRWVDGGYGHSIFLNRTLIEQEKISLETIQRQVANFLMEFEGVQYACPLHEAMLIPSIQNKLNVRHAGDVIFTLQNGYQLTYNQTCGTDFVADEHPSIPVLWWSDSNANIPDIPAQATNICNIILKTL